MAWIGDFVWNLSRGNRDQIGMEREESMHVHRSDASWSAGQYGEACTPIVFTEPGVQAKEESSWSVAVSPVPFINNRILEKQIVKCEN